MRALALMALTGCRAVLGIEDVEPFPAPPPGDSRNTDAIIDAGPDGTPVGCRADYAALPNSGPRNHRYLFVTINEAWTKQRDVCGANNGFLAFPDGATINNAQMELAALVNIAGNGVWLGIDDLAIEGQYRTSLGTPASQATLGLFTGTGGNNSDCLTGSSTTSINDESCTNSHKAVCECVP